MPEISMAAALQLVCSEHTAMEIELLQADDSPKREVTLSERQINELAGRIEVLPDAYQDALLARYCYGMDIATAETFGMNDPRGKSLYARQLLGLTLGLEDDEVIARDSLVSAGVIAGEHIVQDIKQAAAENSPPVYSKKHRKRMKDILRRDSRPSFLFLAMRYAAMFVLVLLLSGAIVLTANAELRERFFSWVAEISNGYVNFTITRTETGYEALSEDGLDERQKSYSPTFIPEGFALTEEINISRMLMKKYTDADDRYILLKMNAAGKDTILAADAEGAEIETIRLFDEEAYAWVTGDNFAFVVWQQDEFQCSIMTQLDKDTAIKIAGSVQRIDSP